MRKPVLFIAVYFPPIGGPGTNRSLQFVNHLSEFGFDPVVFTLEEKDAEFSPYPVDESQLKKISSGIEIVRIKSREAIALIHFLMTIKLYRFIWFFFYPFFWDNYAFFPFYAFFRARKEIKQRKIDLVYTSSGPFSTLLLGFFLKTTTNIKWVADMRDPFTESVYRFWPGKLHWYFSRMMEKAIFKKTDLLIVNTPEVRRQYLKRKLQSEKRIIVLTNGF